MLVVMLIILMATATAFFAIHSTAFEVRASGHVKQSMQTQYVSESGALSALTWVDRFGPVALQVAMRRTSEARRASGVPVLDMEPFNEPQLYQDDAQGVYREGYRMTLEQLETDLGTVPLDRESIGGTRQVYQPFVYVDIYDKWVWTGALAGRRADGGGKLEHMRATYTSRGRTRVAAGDYQTPGDNRQFHEGANDARAHGLSGPYLRRVGGGG